MQTGFIDTSVHFSGNIPPSLRTVPLPNTPLAVSNQRQIRIGKNRVYLDGNARDAVFPIASQGDWLRQILDTFTFAVIEKHHTHPLLHAALLRYKNRTILIPGKSGCGKTTLSYLLHHFGAQLYSDELVGVGQTEIFGFARPLHMRGDAITKLNKSGIPVRTSIPTSEGAYVDAKIEQHSLPLDSITIIMPNWQPERVEAKIEPVRSAAICQSLMAVCVNARNFDDHGLTRLAHLARHVDAMHLSYGKAASVENIIAHLETLSPPKTRP